MNNNALTLNQISESLDNLLQRRIGGSVNIRGIHYQVLYGCYILLQELSDQTNIRSITFEGIEDIDLNYPKINADNNLYIQLKSSVNKADASSFWAMGVLQNFIDAYLINTESRFKLVYNMKIADGKLLALINRKENDSISEFWIEKIKGYNSTVDSQDFLSKVSFEFQSSAELYKKIQTVLIKDWNINKGTEIQFLRSIFYNILIWSKERKNVTNSDLTLVIQEIKDSYSIAPANKAILNSWITKADYHTTSKSNYDDYYDGKAARPAHITMGLPVKRKLWEKRIIESIYSSDVVLIKSSSGQGKSTLAWQAGLHLSSTYTVYQLYNCKNVEELNSVVEFIEARILIGEMPLIIIDGLTNLVETWSELVKRTSDTITKFVITSREEDWHRYGADISKINISIVDIALGLKEAEEIYEQLKRKGKVHSEINEWQPVWEQVGKKGLLIEFTFLLTKGQMIQERLSYQLKFLNNTRSSGAKLEILRMVSLADCLSIRLKTTTLLKHIKDEIGFDQDRDLLISELEKEYLLNFGSLYIEGLHPVRSGHMKDLLHQNIFIESSLINLFKLIDTDKRHDFFINAPYLLSPDNKQHYYNDLAELLCEGKYSDMVYALDGIMHGEPQRYWQENKNIFDEAYNLGGIEIFAIATVPFTKLGTLDELASIEWAKAGAFSRLAELKRRLPEFGFENTEVFLFAKALQNKLIQKKAEPVSYEGLEFLIRWFTALKLSFNFASVTNAISISDVIQMPINEAKELMLYFQISDPPAYRNFTEENHDVLLSYLKYNTNSLTIQEIEGNIHINYILADNEVNKVNEFSMYRINLTYAFLPYFKQYSTEAILLPFPSEDIISVTRDASIKHLTSKTIGDTFNQHLNQLWRSTIIKNYEEGSAYTWQNNIVNIRKSGILWAKNVIRIVDALLEGNSAKQRSSSSTIDQARNDLANVLTLKKAYPTYEKKYFEGKNFAGELKAIDEWFGSLGNINGQLLNIFTPEDEHKRHVALINLKSVYLNAETMQKAFREMEQKTIPYFDSESICIDESKTYKRLYSSVLYYISQLPLEFKRPVPVGRIAVEQWWKEEETKVARQIDTSLKKIEQSTIYKFVSPTSLTETSTLTYCTFGVENVDFTDGDAIITLSMHLSPLIETGCDFFTIVSIKEGTAMAAARFKKDFFLTLSDYKNGDTNISLEGMLPFPVELNNEVLANLPDIRMPETSYTTGQMEIQVKALLDLWQLSEYRLRLNRDSVIEMNWLQQAENEYASRIQKSMSELADAPSFFTNFVDKGIKAEVTYSNSQIISVLYKCLQVK